MPNIFGEFIIAALRFAALWVLFFQLYRPKTLLRRIPAIGIMALQYPFHRILFFASGGNFILCAVCDSVLFLGLAFMCEDDSIVRPIITAVYYYGIFMLINYIMYCYTYAFTGSLPPSFSPLSYLGKTAEGAILLFWAFFYYRIARKMTAKAPISFSLLVILMPIAGVAVISASTNAVQLLGGYERNFFLFGGLFGTLIIVLNMCIFYLYIKLSVAHEALIFAHELAHTPPVWTQEQGLSLAFIEKYEITQREREVVEAMLLGKTDQEIAKALYIAVNTVQAHLKRIYRKTGVSGRFALSALVRGA
jgi:DNA-binding CsgD family transcriptional regulator